MSRERQLNNMAKAKAKIKPKVKIVEEKEEVKEEVVVPEPVMPVPGRPKQVVIVDEVKLV